MILRLASLCILLLTAAIIGQWLGMAISYWFVDPVMRLYPGWTEYLDKPADNLPAEDPLGVASTIAA